RSLEDLDREVDRAHRLERRLLANQLLERPTRQVLHRDEVRLLVLPAVVDTDDVRMLEPRRRLRLAADGLAEPGVRPAPAVQRLQGELAAELLVLGQVHVSHASAAQAREDLVAAVDDRADCDLGHRQRPSESRVWITALA